MGAAESSIKAIAQELKASFDHIEKYPASVTPKQCEELRRKVNSIEYYLKYGGREPWVKSVPAPVELRKCSVEECLSYTTLYLVDGIPFCLDHIPTIMGFPIGLHGEDFKTYKARTSESAKNLPVGGG